LDTLLELVQKEFGPEKSYTIEIQPVEEMSVADRAERKSPKVIVSVN